MPRIYLNGSFLEREEASLPIGDRGFYFADGIYEVTRVVRCRLFDEEAHWNRMLSLGEQQRLGIVRALLQRPDFLFLDETTASLDEAAESALYRLLQDRLPGTTIVSIGHRSTGPSPSQRTISSWPQ